MIAPLTPIRGSRADQADTIRTIAVADNQQPRTIGPADSHKPALFCGVIGVVNSSRHLIVENRNRLVESHPVFPKIASRLFFVPLETN